MKSFLVPLYWIWCGISVFILVKRRVDKKNESPDSTRSDSVPETMMSPASAAAGAGLGTDVTTELTADLAPPESPSPATAEKMSFRTPEPMATSLAPPSDEARAISVGLPISTVDSLAVALQGIALPCGLVPLTGTGEFDPKTLVLFSHDHPAEVVGTALADEIETLGYTLTPLDDHRLMALGEKATVELSIHPDPEVNDEAGNRRFPTAPADTVVVELHLR